MSHFPVSNAFWLFCNTLYMQYCALFWTLFCCKVYLDGDSNGQLDLLVHSCVDSESSRWSCQILYHIRQNWHYWSYLLNVTIFIDHFFNQLLIQLNINMAFPHSNTCTVKPYRILKILQRPAIFIWCHIWVPFFIMRFSLLWHPGHVWL